ncbi:hypothetical protein HUU61_01050 [Rhodopseudomonas palustris]|nr:hypothetical protein [Rhodopseudomonas palustris]
MTGRSKLDEYIGELEAAAYERGKRDAWSEIASTVGSIRDLLDAMGPRKERKSPAGSLIDLVEGFGGTSQREPRDGSDQAKVLALIREMQGLRGVDIVKSLEGQVEERTVRTALHRLKRRELIDQRNGLWFPVEKRLEKIEGQTRLGV